MRDITEYMCEAFDISESTVNEAMLKELPTKKIEKVLKDNGLEKGKSYTVKNGSIYLKSEEIAMELADELTDSKYELSYDDNDNFKVTIFG